MKLKNKYLISLDLDGTLLTDKKTISLKTKIYLKKLSKLGNYIVLTSGRPYRALIKYYNQLKLKTPVVCYNGSLITVPNNSIEPILNTPYPYEDIKKIIASVPREYFDCVMCETSSEIWVSNKDDFLFLFYLQKNMEVHYGDVSKILSKDPFTCIFKCKNTAEAHSFLKTIADPYPNLSLRFWQSGDYCEIYHTNQNKATGIAKLAESLNISLDNVYAFGDSDNDIELISNFKHGIAMINSSKELLKIAKTTTKKDNNHNGIALYLKEHLE
jgi:Cof subfamily protein (haloacid dehalogenase superfamily)